MAILKKEPLYSVNQLNRIISDFKRREKTAITNYIPDPTRHKECVESGQASLYIFETGVFISFDLGHMADVIFVSKSSDDVMKCLECIREEIKKSVVAERVFREDKDIGIGIPNKLLRRMSRVGHFEKPSSTLFAEKASINDIPGISDIFRQYFDPLTERIPDNKELERLIGIEGIWIIRENDGIIGMVVYEKISCNQHLRYWWVSPSHRNKGIGADLLKAYFNAGCECRRQFLWVFSDNANAIEKYRHYGFEFDGTADEIYVIQ